MKTAFVLVVTDRDSTMKRKDTYGMSLLSLQDCWWIMRRLIDINSRLESVELVWVINTRGQQQSFRHLVDKQDSALFDFF